MYGVYHERNKLLQEGATPGLESFSPLESFPERAGPTLEYERSPQLRGSGRTQTLPVRLLATRNVQRGERHWNLSRKQL